MRRFPPSFHLPTFLQVFILFLFFCVHEFPSLHLKRHIFFFCSRRPFLSPPAFVKFAFHTSLADSKQKSRKSHSWPAANIPVNLSLLLSPERLSLESCVSYIQKTPKSNFSLQEQFHILLWAMQLKNSCHISRCHKRFSLKCTNCTYNIVSKYFAHCDVHLESFEETPTAFVWTEKKHLR